MAIIYVIEQLIDEKWVGIQTNFFNSIKIKVCLTQLGVRYIIV
jgi:hypothetical protein